MAEDINKVIIIGNLTRDAELSYSQSGFALLKFSIAVNRRRKQGDQWVDETSFFDVTMFGSRGEAIASYMTKGKKIAVDGQLQQDRWEAQDGTKRSKVVIIADNIQFLSSRDGGTQAGGGQSSYKNDSQSGGWNEESPSGTFNRGGSTGNSGTRNNSRPQGPPPNSFEDDIPF